MIVSSNSLNTAKDEILPSTQWFLFYHIISGVNSVMLKLTYNWFISKRSVCCITDTVRYLPYGEIVSWETTWVQPWALPFDWGKLGCRHTAMFQASDLILEKTHTLIPTTEAQKKPLWSDVHGMALIFKRFPTLKLLFQCLVPLLEVQSGDGLIDGLKCNGKIYHQPPI